MVPSGEVLWGIIVEARKHPLLEHVVMNVHSTLGIPIQIYHGKSSQEFIMSTAIGPLVEKGEIVLTPLRVDTLYPPANHSGFILSPEFWYSMCAREKILLFQTDAILCSKSDYSIHDFLQFDYIGSNWNLNRENNLKVSGGCGGLSVRDWKKSVECLERFPPEYWEGGEDVYFAFLLDVMGGKVADKQACLRFCTQEEFAEESFGAHDITSLDSASLQTFLEYCPEAKPLIDGLA